MSSKGPRAVRVGFMMRSSLCKGCWGVEEIDHSFESSPYIFKVSWAHLTMSKKTHLAFALLLSAYLFRFSPQQLPFVPIVFISAMLPDLDLALKSFPLIEHRKTFHNIWFMIAAAYAIFHFTGSSLIAELSSIGVLSHLLMDSLTKVGVMWFYPLSSWKLRGPLRTGSKADTAIGILSLIGASYLMIGAL